MIVKGIGDSGGLDESTGRTESLLEVVELDELEREAELETIEDTEEPDIIREVNKAVGIAIAGLVEDVACWKLLMLFVVMNDVGIDMLVPRRMLLELSERTTVDGTTIETKLVEMVMLKLRLVGIEDELLFDRDAEEDEDTECPGEALVERNTSKDDKGASIV
ncbi:hypothetical protein MMC34_005878 [Xylographa carneopallida]|nr:hypothetical protein [Xylographa carneopallida]